MFLYGKNAVLERLKANPESIQKIFLQEGYDTEAVLKLIHAQKIPFISLSQKEFMKMKRAGRVQGVIARVDEFQYTPFRVVRVDRANNAIANHYVQLGLERYGGFGTITQAVNSTTVPDNSTLGIVRGSYREAVTISRPLTLISVGGNVTIGSGTYYNIGRGGIIGSDSVSVPANIWLRRPGLAGFEFYSMDAEDEDKHIDEIEIILDSTQVDAAFNDENDDDGMTWSIDWAELR